MAFPIEGWNVSAAVLMRQRGTTIIGEVHDAAKADAERAWRRPYRMWAVVVLNVWLRSQPRDVIGRRPVRSRPK